MFVFVRSTEFTDFIAKCLVKDPDQRSSACDLREVASPVVYLVHSRCTVYCL